MYNKFSKQYVDYLESFKRIGLISFKKIKPIRPKLGDYVSMMILRDILFSTYSLSPNTYIPYLYSWGKFIGNVASEQSLKALDISLITKILTKLHSIKLLENDIYKDILTKTWANVKSIPEISYVDTKAGVFRIKVIESDESWGLPKINKPVDFFNGGIMAGSTENLISRKVNVTETKCVCMNNYDYCEFLGKVNGDFPKFGKYSKKDFIKIKNHIRDNFIKDHRFREILGDYTHISSLQVTYLGLWLYSPGMHTLLYWIGKETGKYISKKIKGKNKLNELKRIMKKLKIGIISINKNNKKFSIKLEESAFSYGAKNIGKKIDSYLAGLFAGYLSHIYRKHYNIIETKCIANGDKYCEFVAL
ncbi:MAG: hypothetical protein J7K26_00505 [Candidatus Aenigmarchaeota archaeon]|nr:hypothetical protein [Candidatus Aenigmarchaeota archaeon]